MTEHDSQGDIVIQGRETMDAVEKERLAAFARDFTAGKESSAQASHWRIVFRPDSVSGNSLTIQAIAPFHTVREIMQLLENAIKQHTYNEGKS